MKTKMLFIVALLLVSFATANAQFIKRGSIIGSGSFRLSVNSDPDSDYRSTDFTLNPWAGFFVIDNLAIGPQLSFNANSNRYVNGNGDVVTSSSTSVGVGPVVRYYLPVGVFFQGDALVGGGSNVAIFSTGAAVGYAVKIGSNVFFDPMLGLNYTRRKFDGPSDPDRNVELYLGGAFTVKFR